MGWPLQRGLISCCVASHRVQDSDSFHKNTRCRMKRAVSVALACLGVCLTAEAQPTAGSARDIWQQFRKAHPYHIQTVALSDREAGGTRTLIISEPPPNTEVSRLKALWPREFARRRLRSSRSALMAGWRTSSSVCRRLQMMRRVFVRELGRVIWDFAQELRNRSSSSLDSTHNTARSGRERP